MKRLKPLTVAKPVPLIFAGGFLSAGKTTALGLPSQLEHCIREALAPETAARGLGADVLERPCFSPAYPNPPYRVGDEV